MPWLPIPTGLQIYRHSRFDLDFRGVYISGMTNARVTSNWFNITSPFSDKGGYGLYLNTSTGYWVEDNDFVNETIQQKGIGIIVNSSGTRPNEIYRNRFSNLTQGISAQQQNCGNNNVRAVGLQVLCNNFDLCTADVLIPHPGDPQWGIAPNQGSDGSDPTDMAGNLFFIPPGPVNNDFDDINNQGRSIIYFYPSTAPGYFDRLKPKDYSSGVTLQENDVFPDWSPETGCPSGIEGGGGGSGSGRDQMAEAQQKIDSTENLLSMLIDGGNTGELQTDVEYSLPPEAMAIYTQLIDNSPYLSDTVVSTAIEKEEVLPNAMIRDVMVANPNTAKNDELLNHLDERWTPLPQYMKEQILQGKNIVSVKEKTESRLAKFKLDKARAMNTLVRNFRNDSLAGNDSLAALFETDNSIDSKYNLAFLSMEQAAWSNATAILNAIPAQFELNAEQVEEHAAITGYFELLESMNDSSPDSTGMLELTSIMETEKGAVSMYALNALIDLGQVEYEEPIEMPEMMKSAEAGDSYKNNSKAGNNEKHRFLQVSPILLRITSSWNMSLRLQAMVLLRSMIFPVNLYIRSGFPM